MSMRNILGLLAAGTIPFVAACGGGASEAPAPTAAPAAAAPAASGTGTASVSGKIAFEGKSADELNNNDLIRKFYLGL